MHRATVVSPYELMNVAGLLLPCRMAAEVAVTEQHGSAGTAFMNGKIRLAQTSVRIWVSMAISVNFSKS